MHAYELFEAEPYLAAYKSGDRIALKKAANFYDRDEFIRLIAGYKRPPTTHYHGFENGELVSSFTDPERGKRYERVEQVDPSRQAMAAYRKYQRFCDSLGTLHGELKHEIMQDEIAEHSFTPDEIEVHYSDRDGSYYATVRGRRVAIAMVNLSAERGMPADTRAIYNVATFDVRDQRKGVARKIYQRVEQDLAAKGLRLVPSKVQYDDAKEFWKRYRPTT